jgi:hypothetical protein
VPVPGPRRLATAARDKLLAGPPSSFESIDPVIEPVASGKKLYRAYSPKPYGTKPRTFRNVGPLERFDHHRPVGPGMPPKQHRGRGILYAGFDPIWSLGEFFGASGVITLNGNRIARLTVTRSLRLLDLRGLAATRVGTAPGIAGIETRATTQAWARYFYEHPDLAEIDGLIYEAFHSGLDSVALWERAKDAVRTDQGWSLGASTIRGHIDFAAYALSYAIAP